MPIYNLDWARWVKGEAVAGLGIFFLTSFRNLQQNLEGEVKAINNPSPLVNGG